MTDVHLRFGELDPDDVRLYPAGPDTGGGGITYARSTTDTARASDSLTRALVAYRTSTDTAGAVDTLTRTVLLTRLLVDFAPAVDEVTRARLLNRLLTDNAPAVDVVTAVLIGVIRARLRVANRPLTGLVVEVQSCPSA